MKAAPQPVRVVRTWPGGPRRGQVITLQEPRRAQLLRTRFVEEVTDTEPPPTPTRKRGTARAPVTPEADLLGRAAGR